MIGLLLLLLEKPTNEDCDISRRETALTSLLMLYLVTKGSILFRRLLVNIYIFQDVGWSSVYELEPRFAREKGVVNAAIESSYRYGNLIAICIVTLVICRVEM